MEFTQQLHQRYGLSQRSLELLAAEAETVCYDRKTVFVREGQRDPYVHFVVEGAVRLYVMREERCVILSFAFEGDAASSSLSGDDHTTARAEAETIEPTTLVRIPRVRLATLFASEAELSDWGRRLAEQRLGLIDEFFAEYAWREKGQQYRLMLREYPQLFQRVPLKDLAAYLYVTPQTLSRIRAERER